MESELKDSILNGKKKRYFYYFYIMVKNIFFENKVLKYL